MPPSRRVRINQPTGVPTYIKKQSRMVRCRHHDYIYFHDSWMDDQTGIFYRNGYYDETGKYYDTESVAFKKADGYYEANYVCDYCGTKLQVNWKEGFYPICKNCGAEMNKKPVYVDEIVNVNNNTCKNNTSNETVAGYIAKKIGMKIIVSMLPWIIMACILAFFGIKEAVSDIIDIIKGDETAAIQTHPQASETNQDIYGKDLYLDQIEPGIYRICSDDNQSYEKHLTWDYVVRAYYDRDSDCYLWHNTDVSPNLWQYWYEDVAGNNYDSWMKCQGEDWYIKVSDTEWEEYEGDTTGLWHIENE